MATGCKCPGSCACKIKKPRKPKVKKAVVGGRVKQPQIVIQGMPAVSTTAIPAGYPYLTVTSDVDLSKKFKEKKTKGPTSLKGALATQRDEMNEKFHKVLNSIVQEDTEREQQKKANQREMGTMTAETGRASTLIADAIAETRTKEEPMKELKGESRFLTKPDLKTPSQQLSLLKSKIAAGTIKQFAPTRMTTAAQTNLIEHVGVGTQATKETKEMGTETEPLLVTVAKGAKADIFNIMKEQEATGKVLSLTGAGRPKREFGESVTLATPSPTPAPAPPAPAAPAVPVGSASSSSAVPGFTFVTRPGRGIVTDSKTGLKYSYSYPGGQVKQMPPVPEIIDLS